MERRPGGQAERMSEKQEYGTIKAIFQKLVYEPETKIARKRKKNTKGALGKAKEGKPSV